MIEFYDLDRKSPQFDTLTYLYVAIISPFNLDINIITRFSDFNAKALMVWKETKQQDVFTQFLIDKKLNAQEVLAEVAKSNFLILSLMHREAQETEIFWES